MATYLSPSRRQCRRRRASSPGGGGGGIEIGAVGSLLAGGLVKAKGDARRFDGGGEAGGGSSSMAIRVSIASGFAGLRGGYGGVHQQRQDPGGGGGGGGGAFSSGFKRFSSPIYGCVNPRGRRRAPTSVSSGAAGSRVASVPEPPTRSSRHRHHSACSGRVQPSTQVALSCGPAAIFDGGEGQCHRPIRSRCQAAAARRRRPSSGDYQSPVDHRPHRHTSAVDRADHQPK